MTITVNTLIRAGAMAQSFFTMKEDFDIRLFPSDCLNRVRVYETPKPFEREEYPSPFVPAPKYDEVDLIHFAARHNNDYMRMGYSRRLNILCLSLE